MAGIILRDIDNRGEDGVPYEFSGDTNQIVGYLDGPLRRDLRDPEAAWLGEAIEHVRSGDLDAANAILNSKAVVYLKVAG